MIAIRLPMEIEDRLDALAKSSGRTKSYYVREAILRHLEDMEDLVEAEKRMADIISGKSKTIPLEEVMKKYGLDH
jgi:RHH-type transcriptional regulator, rel operon repressor / antitoxin RelB